MTADIGKACRVDRWITGGSRPHGPEEIEPGDGEPEDEEFGDGLRDDDEPEDEPEETDDETDYGR